MNIIIIFVIWSLSLAHHIGACYCFPSCCCHMLQVLAPLHCCSASLCAIIIVPFLHIIRVWVVPLLHFAGRGVWVWSFFRWQLTRFFLLSKFFFIVFFLYLVFYYNFTYFRIWFLYVLLCNFFYKTYCALIFFNIHISPLT